jgi:hypothetical protein
METTFIIFNSVPDAQKGVVLAEIALRTNLNEGFSPQDMVVTVYPNSERPMMVVQAAIPDLAAGFTMAMTGVGDIGHMVLTTI